MKRLNYTLTERWIRHWLEASADAELAMSRYNPHELAAYRAGLEEGAWGVLARLQIDGHLPRLSHAAEPTA